MVETTAYRLRNLECPLARVIVDAQAIPFAVASFDVVIANHILYHVPDRQGAISEIRRVLRPGGRFYAATNGAGHLREIDQLIDRFASGPNLRSRRSIGFTLENGTEQLKHQFGRVTLHRFEDGLIVTEAAPLIAYLRSGPLGASIADDRVGALTDFVEDEVARTGSIRIGKATGLFEAW